MARGMTPTEACLETLRSIARRTKQKRLIADDGNPNFNVTMYALRKDGAFGSACIRPGGSFAIATADTAARRQSTARARQAQGRSGIPAARSPPCPRRRASRAPGASTRFAPSTRSTRTSRPRGCPRVFRVSAAA